MKKRFIIAYSAFVFLFLGCGTIERTTKTFTKSVTVPGGITKDSSEKKMYLPLTSERADSIGRWYLLHYCKGSVTAESDISKTKTDFHVAEKPSKKPNAKPDLVMKANTSTETKERTVPAQTTIESTEKTPGQLWIWTHSYLYQGIAFFLGMIVLYILQLKTAIGKKFIP